MDTPSQATLQREWGCSTSRAIPSGRAGARTTSLRLGLELGLELGLGFRAHASKVQGKGLGL